MDQVMNIRVPKGTYQKIKAFAEKDDRTLHQVVRMAMKEFFDRRAVIEAEKEVEKDAR